MSGGRLFRLDCRGGVEDLFGDGFELLPSRALFGGSGEALLLPLLRYGQLRAWSGVPACPHLEQTQLAGVGVRRFSLRVKLVAVCSFFEGPGLQPDGPVTLIAKLVDVRHELESVLQWPPVHDLGW